jgi:hypothetical protein
MDMTGFVIAGSDIAGFADGSATRLPAEAFLAEALLAEAFLIDVLAANDLPTIDFAASGFPLLSFWRGVGRRTVRLLRG